MHSGRVGSGGLAHGERDIVVAARDLRQRQTPAERRLWRMLRDRRYGGLKVRRQHPVGPYVLDFCIEGLLLAIELDGAVHAELAEHDAYRDEWLRALGFTVLRIPNEAVFRDPDGVLARIAEVAGECAAELAERALRGDSGEDG